MVVCGCKSKSVDGRDLHGVFLSARPRASDAAAMTSAAAAASALASAAGARAADHHRIAPLERDPVAGPCVEKAGEPEPTGERVGRRPACRGATILEHRGRGGAPRYACVFAPAGAAERAPLPLLVFFHDVHDTPTAVHKKTRLRRHYRHFDLSGEAAHAGFVVLAPQARRLKGVLRFETGYHHSDNADALAVDEFVAALQAKGLVDGRRIYTVGHGVGGEMAALYAMLRPSKVAAFATFASAANDIRWSCDGPGPAAAILYRACDTVTPCADTEQWLAERERLGAPTLSIRLGVTHREAAACALAKRSCRESKGRNNHVRWPRGREKDMLEYLARYSLRVDAGDARPAPP